MKISDRKFECKEDADVFKALLRAMKEDSYRFNVTSFDRMREKCYNSRKNHPTEAYHLNITYWPQDIGWGPTKQNMVLYLALLVKSLKKSKDVKTIVSRMVSEINALINIKSPDIYDVYLNIDLIKSALKIVPQYKNVVKDIELACKGIKEKIPF